MPASTKYSASGSHPLHVGVPGHPASATSVNIPTTATKSGNLGAFADVYRRQCSTTKSYPLSCLLTPTFFATGTLRVPCDKVVTDYDWDLLIGSLAAANDLRGLCLWSTWWHERKAQLLRLRSTTDVNKARDSIKNKIPLVLHMEITDPLMKSISTAMRHCKQLSSLTLAGIILHPSCVRTLAAAVAKSHSLSHLSLSRCEIGDQGFREIASAIKSSTSLTILDLSDNLLTHTSASLLADALKSQSVRRMESAFPFLLRTTSKKSIDSAYAASSSASTSSRPFLKRVNLCCNPLTNTGLYYLLDALQSDVGVQVLDLQFTKATTAGVEAAWLVLQDVPGTVALDLRNNPDADPELVARVLAMAGDALSARDPELARIPDGAHPLEASLAQGANAPRVPKVKPPQGSRYAVPLPGKSPAKPSHAVGGVQVVRPAWRPAGISQLPVVDGRKGGSKKAAIANDGLSPHGWHPLVDVVQLEELVVKNQVLAEKVNALEHVVLKHTMEEPRLDDMPYPHQDTARSRVSTMPFDEEPPLSRMDGPNLYKMQHSEQQYASQPPPPGFDDVHGPIVRDVRMAGFPHVHEMRHPDQYMPTPGAGVDRHGRLVDELEDEYGQQHHRWTIGPDGQVMDAQGRAFYQSPGIGRPMMTTAVVQTIAPPIPPQLQQPPMAPHPMTPISQLMTPFPSRPPPVLATPSAPAASPATYAAVVATLKSLHTQLKSVTSAWDVHHARRQVLNARWSVVATPNAAMVASLPPPPPVITESLNKLEAMATALDRRWWDKHPDMMRRVTDVDRWVGEVAARTKVGDMDDPHVVEKDCMRAAGCEHGSKSEAGEVEEGQAGDGRMREQSPPLRLQDLQSGTSESGEDRDDGRGALRQGAKKQRGREGDRPRTRTASGKPPLPMVELEEEEKLNIAGEEEGHGA